MDPHSHSSSSSSSSPDTPDQHPVSPQPDITLSQYDQFLSQQDVTQQHKVPQEHVQNKEMKASPPPLSCSASPTSQQHALFPQEHIQKGEMKPPQLPLSNLPPPTPQQHDGLPKKPVQNGEMKPPQPPLSHSPSSTPQQHHVLPQGQTQNVETKAPAAPPLPSPKLPLITPRHNMRSPSSAIVTPDSHPPQCQLSTTPSREYSSPYSQSQQAVPSSSINTSQPQLSVNPLQPYLSPYPNPYPYSQQGAYAFPTNITPQRQISTTPNQQYLSSNSRSQRGTTAHPFVSVESFSNHLGGTREGTTITERGSRAGTRGPKLTRHPKLTLAKLCHSHSLEYYHGNWGKFWFKMSELLKEQTGHEHKAVQNTVERWIKIRQTELFEQEMESGTEEERRTFMEAVDKFTERWQHSHDQATGKPAGQNTKDQENHNVREARHNIIMGNAAGEGIIEFEDDNSPQEDHTTTAPGRKRGKRLAAEDRMADSFARIADFLISSENQGEKKERKKRKRRGSDSESEEREGVKKHKKNGTAELLATMATQMQEMYQVILKMSKKLDDLVEHRG